ncbi:hypothetical protein GCM10027440_10510 [Nocardiopsis coralliicola]
MLRAVRGWDGSGGRDGSGRVGPRGAASAGPPRGSAGAGVGVRLPVLGAAVRAGRLPAFRQLDPPLRGRASGL